VPACGRRLQTIARWRFEEGAAGFNEEIVPKSGRFGTENGFSDAIIPLFGQIPAVIGRAFK
jgi:hypothetical protein